MADYFTQTVVQPSIPNACMTPLERWLLGQMFESEDSDESTYFFTSEGVSSIADGDDPELEAALRDDASPLAALVRDAVAKSDVGWFDLDGIESEVVFQAIVARHPGKVPYVTVEKAYTCSKMRADGFGGAAALITAGEVCWMSTSFWLEERIEALERARAESAVPT